MYYIIKRNTFNAMFFFTLDFLEEFMNRVAIYEQCFKIKNKD